MSKEVILTDNPAALPAATTKIEAGKKYIIQIDLGSGLTKHDGKFIEEKIKSWCADCIVAFYYTSNSEPIKITEIETTNE